MPLSAYVELMKLRIDALLLLVAAAGYVATSGARIDDVRFSLLLTAGFLAAAGASATNHYLDRDLDAVMRRTRARPLPQRRIEPPAHALEFGLGLAALGIAIAGFGINLLTAAMIGLGFAVYIGVYTLGLKRAHPSNIVVGGFAGSCPALAGSAAAANAISLPALLIALLVFLWTPGHFWALAYRSREDYRRAQLPMLPAISDDRTAIWAIAGSTGLVGVAAIAFALTPAFQGLYLVVAVVSGVVLLGINRRFLAHPSPETAWVGYKFSGVYLALLLLAMMADAILRIPV
ncbi:MAG: protoheme IX farnesyltransferase [Methanobacteriota archaeon]|nr:MAG: protoheme IX farnesyltransferase [Euryarchaeota archaeon]